MISNEFFVELFFKRDAMDAKFHADENLLKCFEELPEAGLATAVMTNHHQLPIARPELLRRWSRSGVEIWHRNEPAGVAYFLLESAQSLETLSGLLGQVNLADIKRLFQLFSEGISGRKLLIASSENESENHRGLPYTDGRCIFLPEVTRVFRSFEDNFQYSKVALFHQLGFFEFETFSIDTEGFHEYEQPRLAQVLFQILEGGRVDWRIEHCYLEVLHLSHKICKSLKLQTLQQEYL